jgi:subtilisin family serine protease
LDLPDAICVFTTVAASTGARLPANADVGDQYIVYNGGANALLVYPPLAGKINNLAANASLSVATTKAANFVCVAAGQWIGVLGT